MLFLGETQAHALLWCVVLLLGRSQQSPVVYSFTSRPIFLSLKNAAHNLGLVLGVFPEKREGMHSLFVQRHPSTQFQPRFVYPVEIGRLKTVVFDLALVAVPPFRSQELQTAAGDEVGTTETALHR